jgi:hypothetical protein
MSVTKFNTLLLPIVATPMSDMSIKIQRKSRMLKQDYPVHARSSGSLQGLNPSVALAMHHGMRGMAIFGSTDRQTDGQTDCFTPCCTCGIISDPQTLL